MSNWITITKDTLYEARIAIVIDLCDRLLKADNQADRIPGIIQGRVDHVRRKISGCRQNRLDADPTKVPKGLRDLTVDLIVARLKGALEDDLTKDEAENIARCERDLNRIASCDDVVDQPDNAIDAPMEPTTSAPSFGTRVRNFKGSSQNG